jgi:hypothetical protein
LGEKVGGIDSAEPKSPVKLQVRYAEVPPGTATPVAGKVTNPVASALVEEIARAVSIEVRSVIFFIIDFLLLPLITFTVSIHQLQKQFLSFILEVKPA